MAITREQIKAANKRGSAAIARGPVAHEQLIMVPAARGPSWPIPTARAFDRKFT
jgi:hypothetical protein